MISSGKILSSFFVLLLLYIGAFAQEAARPDRGATLNRNYTASDVESVNLQNGNVNLSIPLAALPPIAGGKLSWTVGAHYNSKIWDIVRIQQEPLGTVWLPYVVDAPSASGGWTIAGQYSIVFRNADDDFDRVTYSTASGLTQGEVDLLNDHQWWKVVLLAPDGSEHELRPLDFPSSSYPGSQDFLRGYYDVIPSGSPMRYYSLDGSRPAHPLALPQRLRHLRHAAAVGAVRVPAHVGAAQAGGHRHPGQHHVAGGDHHLDRHPGRSSHRDGRECHASFEGPVWQ